MVWLGCDRGIMRNMVGQLTLSSPATVARCFDRINTKILVPRLSPPGAEVPREGWEYPGVYAQALDTLFLCKIYVITLLHRLHKA